MFAVAARTVILFLIVFIATRLMGKREVGQLQPFEFVFALSIANLVTVPMDDVGMPMLYSLIPTLSLVATHFAISVLTLKSSSARRVICGRPVVVIAHGQILKEVMTSLRMNIDDLTEQIRKNGFFDIDEIEYAVLETSGSLSILPKAGTQPPSAADLALDPVQKLLPYCVVADGEVYDHNLKTLGISREHLMQRLKENGLNDVKNVVFAAMCEDGSITLRCSGNE